MLFDLGHVVTTPGTIDAIKNTGELLVEFLTRHSQGDWGDVPEEYKNENELSLKEGFRLMSEYSLANGEKIRIVTDADRSVTRILLPNEL